MPNEKDVMTSICLNWKEVRCATLQVHSTRPAQPVETLDGFFCCLAGWSALTGLAIVHWIGCINAIKMKVHQRKLFVGDLPLALSSVITLNCALS